MSSITLVAYQASLVDHGSYFCFLSPICLFWGLGGGGGERVQRPHGNSALDFVVSSLDCSPGHGHCIVFLSKTLYFHR